MYTINSLYVWVRPRKWRSNENHKTRTILSGLHNVTHFLIRSPSTVLTEAERSDTFCTWFSGLHYRKKVHVIDDAEQSCCPQDDRVKLCHVCFANMRVLATQLRQLLSRTPRHPANVPYVTYISIQNATSVYISHMLWSRIVCVCT